MKISKYMYTFCCSQMKQVSVQRASHWKFYLQSIFSPVIKLHPILTFGIWLEGFGSTHRPDVKDTLIQIF